MLCRETVTFTVLAWHNVGNIHLRHMKYKCKQAYRRTCRVGINAHKTENVTVVWFYHIFPRYLLKSAIFGEGGGELLNIKYVLVLSTIFV
jgi:hypothetical protein